MRRPPIANPRQRLRWRVSETWMLASYPPSGTACDAGVSHGRRCLAQVSSYEPARGRTIVLFRALRLGATIFHALRLEFGLRQRSKGQNLGQHPHLAARADFLF